METILAIDIGGSKYRVGLVNMQGNIIEVRRYAWGMLTAESVLSEIITSARELLNKYKDINPISIGVTIPGLADPISGRWVEANFSGISDVNIGPILHQEFGMPVYIDNDAQACALAEKVFGRGKNIKDFIYITVSNGVGGGIFVNDMLYYGSSGHAGEVGHVVVEENGRQCHCGSRGCLEMYAAGPAIVANYRALGGKERPNGNMLDAKYIAELAQQGHEIACKTFEMEGYYLGKVIGTLCNILNPRKVIIGGGVSLSFLLFEHAMWETARSFMYKTANQNLEIQPSKFGQDGGLLGATAVAIYGANYNYNWRGR